MHTPEQQMELAAQYWSFAWHLFSTYPGIPTSAGTHTRNAVIPSYHVFCGSRNGSRDGDSGENKGCEIFHFVLRVARKNGLNYSTEAANVRLFNSCDKLTTISNLIHGLTFPALSHGRTKGVAAETITHVA